jgi:uncharacterized protein YhfF
MERSLQIENFWHAYLATVPNPRETADRFYETFQIGSSENGANEGARLILEGIKTATSSLLWEYEAANKPLPTVGSLSLLKNGKGEAVCIVETTSIAIQPFNEVDSNFAYAYGEGDRTLEDWRKFCWDYYATVCAELGKEPALTMPLVCEHFRVVYF